MLVCVVSSQAMCAGWDMEELAEARASSAMTSGWSGKQRVMWVSSLTPMG